MFKTKILLSKVRKFVIIFFDHYHTVKKKEEEKEFIEE